MFHIFSTENFKKILLSVTVKTFIVFHRYTANMPNGSEHSNHHILLMITADFLPHSKALCYGQNKHSQFN